MNKLVKMALGPALAATLATSALAQGMTEVMHASDDITALPGVTANPDLAAGLPQTIRDAGVLRVATDLTPPISFHDDAGKLIGIDADIAASLGVILGVEVQMTDLGAGAGIVPAILSRRFDMTISGINDDPELEKQVDVIDYMYDATTIMVLDGNPLNIASMDDLCGKRVAVPVGTFQNRLVTAFAEGCAEPMNIMSLPKMPEVLQAVRSGRADATVNGYATSVYSTEKQVGKGVGLQALPDIRLAVGYLGMLTHKENPELRDTVVAALQQMVDAGGYAQIMEKWGLAPLAVETVKVNDAASMPVETE
ncbi:ABC transporter substrate-binding protein [Alloyangia pacifica]|uniref:Amino acid ABC transporter substrate-binding protein, PAAT family n=1 Tax=Alloyangia pacifica TaxID=311180 RepID=A0A1I6QEC6_9RHOB|nr:ABC transporter substrate-binding protein [Alloyangia pacifica]SDF87606.1 amino acid ABC transporter substrate-binding protein, PAAT family [Alloyangia pacifica]SFS50640.1 amino acid ABC transporter substrate-binding protein, PAAT family [Alloyangia pacifica]